jgi:hypothetical protein
MVSFKVTDAAGAQVGRLAEIWASAETNDPEWGRIVMNTPEAVERAVPLVGVSRAGDDLVLPFYREQVLRSPEANVTPESYGALCDYYGVAAAGLVPRPAPGPPDDWP